MREKNTERRTYVLNVDFTSEYGECVDNHILHLNKYEVEAACRYDPFEPKKPEDGGSIFLTREMAKAILEKPVYWFWNKKEIAEVKFCSICQRKRGWDLNR